MHRLQQYYSNIFYNVCFRGETQSQAMAVNGGLSGIGELNRSTSFRCYIFFVLARCSFVIRPVQNEVSAEGSLLQNRVLYRKSQIYTFYIGNP